MACFLARDIWRLRSDWKSVDSHCISLRRKSWWMSGLGVYGMGVVVDVVVVVVGVMLMLVLVMGVGMIPSEVALGS